MSNFSMQRVKIAVAQICSGPNTTENLQLITKMVKEARSKDCKMIFFPECSDFMEGEYNDINSELKNLSKNFSMWMSIGIHALSSNNTKYRNRQIILDHKGNLIEQYDKIHLFELLKESDRFEAGDHIKLADTPVGYLGLGICYDIRFPKFCMKLREMGAQCLSFPSAFTMKTGVHFEPLLIARAIETQCFVIAAAQVGKHVTRESFGNSLIIDPFGKILARGSNKPELLVADIDLDYLNEVRSAMSIMDHVRSDIYS
eukprot:NODE_71_length_24927_cov_1.205937.p14 type:complete len:258 gc:universal NODE_71_length_24927_cov_1.205937:2635-1862(-)